MKRQIITIASSLLLCSTLVACSQNGFYVRNRDVGAVAGAVGGGVLGSAIGNTPGAIIGAVGGGVVGYQVGKHTERNYRK